MPTDDIVRPPMYGRLYTSPSGKGAFATKSMNQLIAEDRDRNIARYQKQYEDLNKEASSKDGMQHFLDGLNHVGSAVSPWLGIAASIFNGIYTHNRTKYYQKRAEDFQLKMFNLQNQYNTPVNQMRRMRAAGLNPNFSPNSPLEPGNSSGYGETPAPPSVQQPAEGFGQILQALPLAMEYAAKRNQVTYSDLLNTSQRIENTFLPLLKDMELQQGDAEIKKLKSEVDKNEAETFGQQLQNEITSRYGSLEAYERIENLRQQTWKSIAEVNNLIQEFDQRQERFPEEMRQLKTAIAKMQQEIRNLEQARHNLITENKLNSLDVNFKEKYGDLRNQSDLILQEAQANGIKIENASQQLIFSVMKPWLVAFHNSTRGDEQKWLVTALLGYIFDNFASNPGVLQVLKGL